MQTPEPSDANGRAAEIEAPDPGPVDPSARLRPGFTIDLPVPAEEAIPRLREGLAGTRASGPSMAAGRQVDLRIDASRTRTWSPRLTVHVEDAPDGCTLSCRFAPRPEIWTGFMFLYSLCVFGILFGATLGYVQQVSDETPWGYWAIPAGLLIIAGIHLAGYLGQRLAADQMAELRHRLDQILQEQFASAGSDADSDQPG